MPRLPEIKNVMERDATHCQRSGMLCKEMPCIARGLEKRESMLEKRKNVESHAWGDLKCDRAVIEMEHRVERRIE